VQSYENWHSLCFSTSFSASRDGIKGCLAKNLD